jgi:5-methyltetrahydrofolate--homocysteine methyltransferase
MAIQFSPDRWERIREVYGRWWSGQLERPVINVTVRGVDPGRAEPAVPSRSVTAEYALDVPAEDVVDRWDYDLSRFRFPADAFPHVWPNFGPGVMAEFLGARAEVGNDTVWFVPTRHVPIEQMELAYREGSPWMDRLLCIYRATVKRWNGLVQVSMTDLGGNLDILSTFLQPGQLATDLYDHPEHVKRLTWQVHDLWFRYFDRINRLLQPVNPGYTCWCPIFSSRPYYMLQCDFSSMISPAMFDEFVKPELAATCRRLPNTFYHLDGPGQLPHLDSLLEIPELKGIQWVPGAGQPDWRYWPDVFRRIRAAGKLIQVYSWPLETLDVLAEQIGSPKGICLIGEVGLEQEDQLLRLIERYGAQ